jgi:flagellum-specific ATP synthase
MDSLTRICMAQRELGLATGEPPTTRGYPPSAFAIIPQLLERAGQGVGRGSITAYYTALLEADDLGDPIGDAIRAVTDGHIVLSRRLADQGHFPAIDVLQSTSRVMSLVVSLPHRQAAADVRRVMANLAEAEELQTFGAYRRGEVPRFDLAMDFAVPLRTYLRQMADETADFDVSREAILKMGEALRASEQELGL